MTCRWNDGSPRAAVTLTCVACPLRGGGERRWRRPRREPVAVAVNEHLLTSLLNVTV